MDTSPNINIKIFSDEDISSLCKKYFIKKLSVFGSTLHGDATPMSDVDMLVEFLPDHTPGFLFIRIQDELTTLFHRQVDLHTPASLSKYFRNEVLEEAYIVYDEN